MSSADSLEDALKANLELQGEIARQLQCLARRKAKNRCKASHLIAKLTTLWNDEDMSLELEPPADSCFKSICLLKKEIAEAQNVRNHTTNDRESCNKHRQDMLNNKKRPLPSSNKKKLLGRWRFDPYRRWNRLFFTDPDGSSPEPNADTIKRRKIEEGTFFYHKSPPWSSKESTVLRDVISKQTKATIESTDRIVVPQGPKSVINYDEVARLFEERIKGDRTVLTTAEARNAQDCQLHHQHDKKIPPLTKQESIKILEHVHLSDGQPNWKAVSHSLGNGRTPWQCLVMYQTKLRGQSLPWTRSQDELLFKYTAAMGPQWLLDVGSAAQVAVRLFPGKATKQILPRINQSLLNPNFIKDTWPKDDERKLSLCMKIYRDTASVLYRAAAHFPDRGAKSVSDKWNRCLNPEYSSQPFTEEEDKALLETVRKYGDEGWTQIARQHFPHRHPQQLLSRWNMAASDKDMLKKYGETIVRDRAKRGIVGTHKGALLRIEDFVVKVKPQE